jgi:hypothetical protein
MYQPCSDWYISLFILLHSERVHFPQELGKISMFQMRIKPLFCFPVSSIKATVSHRIGQLGEPASCQYCNMEAGELKMRCTKNWDFSPSERQSHAMPYVDARLHVCGQLATVIMLESALAFCMLVVFHLFGRSKLAISNLAQTNACSKRPGVSFLSNQRLLIQRSISTKSRSHHNR